MKKGNSTRNIPIFKRKSLKKNTEIFSDYVRTSAFTIKKWKKIAHLY